MYVYYMYMESKNTPLVSVVTPVYNRGQFVQRALFSALRQEYQNMEFIVVDDGSTDDTKQIILSIQDQDKRVILIENTKNQWISISRNKWMHIAKWKYIAPLDSDDEYVDPYKTHKQVAFLEQHPDIGFLGTNNIVKQQRDNAFIFYKSEHPLSDDIIKESILSHNPFCHSTVMYRNIYDNFGGYPEDILHTEDYGYWLRAGTHTKFANLPDYTTLYNSHNNNTSHIHRLAQKLESLWLSWQYRNDYPNAFRCLSTKAYGGLYSWLSSYMEIHYPLLKDEIRRMLWRPTRHSLEDKQWIEQLIALLQIK